MARTSFIFACVSLAVLVILTQELHSAECRRLKLRKKNYDEFRKVLLQTPTKLPGNEVKKIAKNSGNLLIGDDANGTGHPLKQSIPIPSILADKGNESPATPMSKPDYFGPTAPGHSPGIGHSFSTQSDGAVKESSSPDYFAPSIPGRSLDVGHSLEHSLPKPPSLRPEDNGSSSNQPDYFRATTPPGIGHSFFAAKDRVVKENSSLDDFKLTTLDHSQGWAGHSLDKRMEDNESPDNQPDYFRPTTPGHSPGIGHHFSAPLNGVVKENSSLNDFETTTQSHNPSVGHSIDQSLSTPSNLRPEDNESPDNQPDYFRPTTPGHSPGIGHHISTPLNGDINDNFSPNDFRSTTRSHSPSVGHYFSQSLSKLPSIRPKDDESPVNQPGYFRPTTPGHSPGVGHVFFVHSNGAAKEKSFLSGVRNTSPRYSPGMGHSLQN